MSEKRKRQEPEEEEEEQVEIKRPIKVGLCVDACIEHSLMLDYYY